MVDDNINKVKYIVQFSCFQKRNCHQNCEMNHPELTCGILETCNRNILEQTKQVQKMYLFFYQSTIITFLQTKTKNKKLKIFIKKQLTKHYITLLPFIIFSSKGLQKVQIL